MFRKVEAIFLHRYCFLSQC